jgi:hypothetical protein
MITTLHPPSQSANTPMIMVTYREAARIIGGDKPVSLRHIERLVKAKKLRSVGRNRARRIVYSSILAYIESEAGR